MPLHLLAIAPLRDVAGTFKVRGGGGLSKITIMIAKELALPYNHISANDEVKMA